MGVDWRVPGSFAMVRSYARDGVTRAVSGGEPFRPLHPYRASGGRFDSAPGERTTGRDAPASERTDPPVLPLLLRKRPLVRLPRGGLQAVDQGPGRHRDGPGHPDRYRPVRCREAAPRAVGFSANPPFRSAHRVLPRAGAGLHPLGLVAVMNLPWVARKPAAVHLLVVGIVFLCLFGLFLDSDVGLVQAMGRDTTLTGRTAFWDKVLDMTVDPLFGAGFESFWLGERL